REPGSNCLTNAGAQLLDDLQSGFVGGVTLGDVERDRADAGVTASTIALAEPGEIDGRLAFRPRVRSDRNLYPERTLAQADAVDRVGMQVVRNELVVAFEVEVGDIEENRAVFFYRALPQNLDGTPVAFEQRRQDGGYEWLLENFGERVVREQRNHALNEVAISGGFDGHGQLHGWGLHFYRRLCVYVHGAVDDIGPVHQLRDRAGIEAEVFFRDHRNETCTGLECRVVELAVALVLLEVGGIGRGKKSAFVVIEPPGDFGRTGILEIDDGILVAVELLLVKKRAGTMQQAGVHEVHIAADSFPVETGEQGGRGSAAKTLVVIKDPHSHNEFPYPFLFFMA